MGAPEVGQRFGRFVLRQKIAEGGMGSVWLSEVVGDSGVRKFYAVKLIHAHLANDERFRAMFLDEARLTERIEHPNVCGVVEYGESEGQPFLAMEHLNGEPWLDVLKGAWRLEGGAPLGVVLRVLI